MKHRLLIALASTTFACTGQVEVKEGPSRPSDAPPNHQGAETNTPNEGRGSVDGPSDTPAVECRPSDTTPSLGGPGNAPSLVRRLTGAEYAATVAAGLEIDVDAGLLAPEVRVQGFINDYGTLLPSRRVIQGVRDFGQTLGARLLEDDNVWLGEEGCRPEDSLCIDNWIRSVGEPLFRRPLEDSESRDFAQLFEQLLQDRRTAAEAAMGTLRALLMAPQTLYRIETRDGGAATPLELASRLAFFVSGAGPDSDLIEAALSGSLARPEELEAQVRRLLRLPAAAHNLDELSYGWLHLDTFEGLTPTGNPDFDRELIQSAQSLVREVWLKDGRELRDVLRATYVIPASERAARRMGVEGARIGERNEVGDDPRRASLLTEPAVLAGTGRDSFPLIHRALFVYKDLLCREVPEPPDGVTDAQPGDPNDSERVQSESRKADGSCGGCHGAFDHLAYAFEPFDFGGTYREIDDFGNATRTDGYFIDADGQRRSYAHPAEFAALLSEDPRVNPCILRRIVRFAWGRRLGAEDRCDLEEIQARFEALGSTYEAALIAVVTHPSFAAKGN